MAKLSSFRINSRAVEGGEWVSPGEEYDDLEILMRGLTDSYNDARAAKMRKAATPYGGNQLLIPTAVSRGILVDCLEAHVILDVRNLVDDNGDPVALPAFLALLREPDFADLVMAVLKAVGKVGLIRADSTADAVGNSAAPSD